MRAADAVLHASIRPEPFGLVVVEAMALGRAVVASRLGGPSEIVSEGTGLLFDPSRPEELSFLLAQLHEQPALRARLGAAGRERARTFDVSRTVEGVERCYSELLGLAQPGGAPGRPPALPAAAGETRGTMPGTP
jgi:glycosyltransferase involved in cell wall biosynthesis